MLRLQSTFALLLALSLFFNKAHGFWWPWSKSQVIGYAMVSEEHADLINTENDLVVEDTTDYQIGPGFYLRDKPSWESQAGKWYCVVKADKKKMKEIRKTLIPEYYESNIKPGRKQKIQLWGAEEEVILHYIRSYQRMYEPEEVLRFSRINGLDQQLQMNIPTKMAIDGDLGFWAKCFETKEKLRKYSDKTIEWERDWMPRIRLGRATTSQA
ncbi:hypothetical protein MBM_02008 [Drepanopeziza brunnea f. sp. 'multigermtubi' MB_m1]|uniref:DUF2931 family protein n=1 Tax=Marssonina brunnea f. sp. multigermtubi (strain MB_m1) TaxID=1072389 RepID=K1X4E3_MARBU|nr:uncharacterized protein MBM_02008 [Drepanopeziza brunnea f. sp. 'multigermtubi' MB_m1]EKD20056.1 hypothetical protein MBM_02008 [Drepanopeziza brunnea f. sp. 'multigermtubi' MB_m1]